MNDVERHAQLVAEGWSVRLDGKWRPPDPHDLRAFTFATAWLEHVEQAGHQPDPAA